MYRILSALLLLNCAAALADRPAEAVVLDRPDAELYGSLYWPEGAGQAVILHAGSGPTDRHGNQPGMQNDSLRLLARGLVAEGIAVLAIDKRFAGESRTSLSEAEIRPSVYVEDLRAWVDWLHARNAQLRIHLLGHSEGALFAKAAAMRSEVASVISLAGAGRPAGVILREQTEGRRPGEIGVEFERVLSSLESGQRVDEVSPLLQALFRPSIQPYLIEWLAIDPAALAAGLDVPLLVIGGSSDIQVGRADFDALAAHADRAEWIDGMNHVLKAVEGALPAQLPSYTDPSLPLHEALLPLIADWIEGPVVE
ncbi:alpha/beta hydrolase [Wenzhouxiangella marina]|uniref:Hydrolase of the alpha/beta superfamily n=1 Tax=Wenzhouxiangella marina TaxID=1579979 RepID=A0A0K0XXV9_9GAMM|nr:alpha/beta fold hydrolase [Wenzhouxiangella marina]AKS42467.1 Hydrolase of the alpha/beta superfamily [Wenzhouxiangella marina]MBB6085758.1 hypothetical protein [Wenzhouxiangella marina]